MLRVRISVVTASLSLGIRPAIAWAREAGAQGVQFDLRSELKPGEMTDTARRQLLHLLSEHQLQAASGHFPLRGPLTEADRLDERLAAIRRAIRLAGQLRLRVLTLRSGRFPDPEDQDAWGTAIGILNELAADGNREGVALHLLPAGDPPDRLRQVLSQVRSGPLGVDADLAAWVLHGQSPTVMLREFHDRIGHVEARDGQRDVDGYGEETPLGRGEVDWDEVAGLLGEMDYSGWLNVNRTQGNDRATDIARAVQYLRNVFPGMSE